MSESPRPSFSRWSCACLPAIWFLTAFFSFAPKMLRAELLPPGFRPLPLGVHALAGGKVVIKPGEVLEHATIVIRDGFITAVGPEAAPPLGGGAGASVDIPKRRSQIGGMKYRVVIEPDEDGVFVAECPALPGCISQGKTRAEALANIKDAMTGY